MHEELTRFIKVTEARPALGIKIALEQPDRLIGLLTDFSDFISVIQRVPEIASILAHTKTQMLLNLNPSEEQLRTVLGLDKLISDKLNRLLSENYFKAVCNSLEDFVQLNAKNPEFGRALVYYLPKKIFRLVETTDDLKKLIAIDDQFKSLLLDNLIIAAEITEDLNELVELLLTGPKIDLPEVLAKNSKLIANMYSIANETELALLKLKHPAISEQITQLYRQQVPENSCRVNRMKIELGKMPDGSQDSFALDDKAPSKLGIRKRNGVESPTTPVSATTIKPSVKRICLGSASFGGIPYQTTSATDGLADSQSNPVQSLSTYGR